VKWRNSGSILSLTSSIISVLRRKALRQKLWGLGGIQSDAGTIPKIPASREFRGRRRQLRKALISGCSQCRTLAQARGTQSRNIGVDAPTKGRRHLVARLPLMAWMPHRTIDQPQVQRVRDRIMSKPFRALPWGTFFDRSTRCTHEDSRGRLTGVGLWN
jgi:hypothetical protein